MAITYPLAIPSLIGEMEANLKKFDAVGEAISPFAGSAQQQQWQDQHWELDLVWPEMVWAQAAALDAFLGALHGKYGSFLWGPPQSVAGPLGSGLGSPECLTAIPPNGTNQPGNNLIESGGWDPSAIGVLLPGDFLQVTVTVPRLYQYVGQVPLVSSALGVAIIDIFPSVREQIPPATPIVIAGPQGTFRLAANRRENPQKRTKTFSMQLKAREAT
jgi:hypothetical protein